MKHIENIVVGKPIAELSEMFAFSAADWDAVEFDKTFFTEERYLPRILVELGIYPSVSEIKRNKPELMLMLDKPDFIEIKAKKKVPLWICVGN